MCGIVLADKCGCRLTERGYGIVCEIFKGHRNRRACGGICSEAVHRCLNEYVCKVENCALQGGGETYTDDLPYIFLVKAGHYGAEI